MTVFRMCATFVVTLTAIFLLNTSANSSQVEQESRKIYNLHAVIRPLPTGEWFIQNDQDHMSIGISGIRQTEEELHIDFDREYSHVGTIQITSDDGFATSVTGHASVGLNSATIIVMYEGRQIDPADIVKIKPEYSNNGNFWINLTMIDVSL